MSLLGLVVYIAAKLGKLVAVFLKLDLSFNYLLLLHSDVFSKLNCLLLLSIDGHLSVEERTNILHKLLHACSRRMLLSCSENVLEKVARGWWNISD